MTELMGYRYQSARYGIVLTIVALDGDRYRMKDGDGCNYWESKRSVDQAINARKKKKKE